MGIYWDAIFPKLMRLNIGKRSILLRRCSLLKNADGETLEIGIGEGINLPLYPSEVTHITAVDPYPRKLTGSFRNVTLLKESAEKMHFEDNSFDSVISTFSLCSVEDLSKVCSEIFRVLKPGGKFLFLEHGSAKACIFKKLQQIFNPLFNKYAYGCNINRSYLIEIKDCGFYIKDFRIDHAPIYPRFLTGYLYQGIAIKPGMED